MLNLIRYIDRNAPEARIVGHAADYPYGSAFHYRGGKSPPWLTRDALQQFVSQSTSSREFTAQAYDQCFGGELSDGCRALVEDRIRRGMPDDGVLDDLVGAAPDRVASWMASRAMIADGTKPGPMLVAPDIVDACLAAHRTEDIVWSYREARRPYDLHVVAHVALLREASSASWALIARSLSCPVTTVRNYFRVHRKLLGTDVSYVRHLSALLGHAIALQHGGSTEPGSKRRRSKASPPF